ncbi:HTH-type transcriptional regulator (TetR family protein) [Desulforapulum autotrophicum HRM2]|uniref:HTH-type transcriptional regulator (TetR family protein) n=1 Tax=Desulforapulum autotrophicum (strain ATCC 43914 / DSM 3382 / VKM B-1955 / HRM2) TaxID=177437 RepID=C0QDU0_DESAH|nr:TetR/AcrR family transcriptional regulator [Desulforapulum autotrophicum]ACN17361.1 HTH-type transcriptional regulator (TetR family protein) [Desulforapulum autotrophicum HRM2]
MEKNNTLIKLKEKERELRQVLIIEAAREVFGQKTYDKASMAEIAKAAGISKSSIYTYFNSQEELYAQIAYQDACKFIKELNNRILSAGPDPVRAAIDYFLDFYIENASQWRMVTHFALHGNNEMGAVEQLNKTGRELMDVFEMMFVQAGCTSNTRIMAHTLFACLSGILIAFRNYPGRSEKDRITHMKKIGSRIEGLINIYISNG